MSRFTVTYTDLEIYYESFKNTMRCGKKNQVGILGLASTFKKVPGLALISQIVDIIIDPKQDSSLVSKGGTVEEVLFPSYIKPRGNCNLVESVKEEARPKRTKRFLWTKKFMSSRFYKVLIIGKV